MYSENYKTLMRETEDDTVERYSMLMDWVLLLIMTILPKAIIRFRAIPSKYQWHVFLELEKITLNFLWKYKIPPNSQKEKKEEQNRRYHTS